MKSILDFETAQSQAIKAISKDFNTAKEKLFLAELEEQGIEFDENLEKKRRFKNFTRTFQGGTETIYYADGSVDGLRIISFMIETPMNFPTDTDFKISCTLKYW